MILTKAKLMTNFADWLHKNTVYKPLPNRSICSVSPREHRFYPIRQLEFLIKLLQLIPNDSHQFMGRYIVTSEHRILFSRDGEPGYFIPTHLQMSHHKPVLAAGNFFFNQKGEITAFNHDSSDFQLIAESLVWPLFIVELMSTPLAEDFHLIPSQVDHALNSMPTEYICLNKTDRNALLSKLDPAIITKTQNTNYDAKVILNEKQSLVQYQITPPFNFTRMYAQEEKNETNQKDETQWLVLEPS